MEQTVLDKLSANYCGLQDSSRCLQKKTKTILIEYNKGVKNIGFQNYCV